MENIENIKSKLLALGYRVYLTEIDSVQYLRGGIISDDISKNLNTEIWIREDNNIFIFLDIENQKGNEKPFNSR